MALTPQRIVNFTRQRSTLIRSRFDIRPWLRKPPSLHWAPSKTKSPQISPELTGLKPANVVYPYYFPRFRKFGANQARESGVETKKHHLSDTTQSRKVLSEARGATLYHVGVGGHGVQSALSAQGEEIVGKALPVARWQRKMQNPLTHPLRQTGRMVEQFVDINLLSVSLYDYPNNR